MGFHWNRLSEAIPMSTHMTCFDAKIKIDTTYPEAKAPDEIVLR